ncbi:hypothetical protein EGP64_01005 [bacterium]|nr:hypothetical protein [bacterium]
MDLLKYINGVLFIDDNKDDVNELNSYFEKYNVPSMFINPNEYTGEVSDTIGFARFVFLDIEFSPGTPDITYVVNLLRDLSEKGMSNVVLIMWTLHDHLIDELNTMITEKMGKNKPILIFDAKKSDFQHLDEEKFNEKLEALLAEKISDEPIIFKMLEWEKSANVAAYKTFNDILQMSYRIENGSFDIENTLSNMASQNIPNNSLRSSFDTSNIMLVDKIKYEVERIDDMELPENEDKNFLRKINYYMMFYKTGLLPIHPGNIYFKDNISNKNEEIINTLEIEKERIQPFYIDLTPACSFAHSDNLILLDGLLFKNITEEERKKIKKVFESESFYKDVYVDEDNNTNYFLIDFFGITSIRKDSFEFDVNMCLKDTYRVNIQQKFGNYLARIGDNIYHK